MNIHIHQISPPGICFGYSNDYLRNKERNFFHLTHSLDYGDGYRKIKPASPQDAFNVDDPKLDCDQFGDLVKLGCLNKAFYTSPSQYACRRTLADENLLLHAKNAESNPVLRFYAYKIDSLDQAKPFLHDNWRLRKFIVYYFTVDNTVKVWENLELNSGFEQGIHLRRSRYTLPGRSGVFWSWHNLNVGLDLELAGHKFHLYDCDEYTRYYFEYHGGCVKPKETCPGDPYFTWREFINRPRMPIKEYVEDPLARFLIYDGIVLTFEVVVDDSMFPAGDIRRMVLKHYLVDGSLELIQPPVKNSGYDPVRAVIGRQKVPKDFYKDVVRTIGDKRVPEHYTAVDLQIGQTLLLFGRKVTICDCDEFTKKWYREKYGVYEFLKIDLATLLPPTVHLAQPQINPWHPNSRQGGYDDSLQNGLSLHPEPPRQNFLQQIYYSHEVLRFEAQLVTQEPSDKGRIFMFLFYVGDGTLTIMEQTVSAINSVRKTFLSRRKVTKEGTMNPPEYFTEQDFTIGSVHFISGRYFKITSCDEHVINFAHQHPEAFTETQIEEFQKAAALHDGERNNQIEPLGTENDGGSCNEKVMELTKRLHRWYMLDHPRIYQLFMDYDKDKTDQITPEILMQICRKLGIPNANDSAVIYEVYQRLTGRDVCSVMFTRFLHSLNMLLRDRARH